MPYLIQETRNLRLFQKRSTLALPKRRKKVVVDPNPLLVHSTTTSFSSMSPIQRSPNHHHSRLVVVSFVFFIFVLTLFYFIVVFVVVTHEIPLFLTSRWLSRLVFVCFIVALLFLHYCSPFSIFCYRMQLNDWLTCWWIVGFIATTCWCCSTTTSFSSMSSIHRSQNHDHSRLVAVSFVFFIFVLTSFYFNVVFVVVTHEIPLFLLPDGYQGWFLFVLLLNYRFFIVAHLYLLVFTIECN